jgi:nuclear pore complex protein Nup62
MIREMNDLTGKSSTDSLSADGPDPLAAVTQILSAHVSSLGWINESTEGLNSKVAELEKRISNQSLGQSTGLRQNLAGSRRR